MLAMVMAIAATGLSLASVYYALRLRQLARHRAQRADMAATADADAPATDDPFVFFESREQRTEWCEYLRGFHAEVYPLFAPHGISMGEALVIWQVSRVRNAIVELGTDPDEGAPWKPA